MIEHKIGDLFDAIDEGIDVIAHQVNCRGVMGSGVARQFKARFPVVFQVYSDMCLGHRTHPEDLLGRLLCNLTITTQDRQYAVACMFAQLNYGRDKRLYTDYEAFRSCLRKLRAFMVDHEMKSVAFPDHIGCGLGGGDWEGVILPMIREVLCDMDVTIYKLPATRTNQKG